MSGQGIACAGNWIVDLVKIIDCWPPRGELANILEESFGVGGGPANVLTDLHRLGFPHPVYGLGCVGEDDYGARILTHCRAAGITTELLVRLPEARTSFTDVMTLQESGERTFFHYRGANALFTPEHVSIPRLKEAGIKLFYLGYLLLLDAMDRPDPQTGTVAAGLLKSVREAGIETCLDVVSESSDRFQRVVVPSLPYVDHCIVNEIEAGRITGIEIRTAGGTVERAVLGRAAARLLELGVSRTAVIHFPEGSLWRDTAGREVYRPALRVPKETVVGAVGAGDAFCAGVLYGIHEGWDPAECLSVGSGAAATCLQAANTTDGVRSLEEVRERARSWTGGKEAADPEKR